MDTPMPPNQPVHARALRHTSLASRETPRPIKMTARETHAMTNMFDSVWNLYALDQSATDPSDPFRPDTGIGRRQQDAGIFDRLGTGKRRLHWTTEDDELLDRKREQMELCETDLQLLEWAMSEVFDESRRYEEAARRAGSASALQPAFYPHLLAQLMRTFRDKYRDPHLALSVFEHARHLSTASFVFGCTTPAFNELIETRWRCFRDLRGVCDALEEMRVNGIEFDGRTRKLAEDIRHEVGERNLWQEESAMGSGEVWELVARIERLITPPADPKRRGRGSGAADGDRRRTKRWSSNQELWKRKAITDTPSSSDAEQAKFDEWMSKQGGLTFRDPALS